MAPCPRLLLLSPSSHCSISVAADGGHQRCRGIEAHARRPRHPHAGFIPAAARVGMAPQRAWLQRESHQDFALLDEGQVFTWRLALAGRHAELSGAVSRSLKHESHCLASNDCPKVRPSQLFKQQPWRPTTHHNLPHVLRQILNYDHLMVRGLKHIAAVRGAAGAGRQLEQVGTWAAWGGSRGGAAGSRQPRQAANNQLISCALACKPCS